jgi:probable HAF family extracellular repeat protein
MFRKLMCVAAVMFAVVPISLQLAAQEEHLDGKHRHHHYKLIDIGTFGGPGGGISNPSSPSLNSKGMLVGVSDTSLPDPFAPDCFTDCFVNLGFLVRDDVVTPLSPLPTGIGLSSFAVAINDRGQVVGQAQNGAVDPLTGWPESHAVLWERGRILDLRTLGGTQSIANSINNSGQVAGAALTAVSDPFANSPVSSVCFLCAPGATFASSTIFFPGTTETHAFVWQNGELRDLQTLGGPDSNAWFINDRGEVAGWSFTSFVANPSSGVPTVDPFFWSPEDGKMIDLGSLGGTYGSTYWLNNRGQVVGASNLAGDTTEHPFIWSKWKGIQDLGTLGGTFGHPDSINDAGEVVGFSFLQGDTVGHGFLWRNGAMTDLGTVGTDPDSEGVSINSRGQVAGTSFILGVADLHGFLWENGGPLVDLNTLVLPGTSMTVTSALLINERGDIGCLGLDPSDTITHACLLIPCDQDHPGIDGCDYSMVDATTAAQVRGPQAAQSSSVANENRDRPVGSRDRLDGQLIHGRRFSSTRPAKN